MSSILPGQLIYIFAVSILDAALLSWLALLWYRRSVRRLMSEGVPASGSRPAVLAQPAAATTNAAPDGTDGFSLTEEPAVATGEMPLVTGGTLRRVILAYCVGAAAYAAVITALKFTAESSPLPPVAWLVEWWMNTWPIVPTLVALMVLDRRVTLRLALVYLIVGAVVIALFTLITQLLRGTLNSAPLTNVYWAMLSLGWAAAIPLALVAFTGWRRVRAIMPLALAATLVFGFSSLIFRELLVRALNVDRFRSLFLSGSALSSPQAFQSFLFIIVSLPVAWIAWRLLKMLGDGYRMKRFSDVQLVIDCWWAVVAAEMTATTLSSTYGLAGVAGGVAAFLAYRVAVFAVLRGVHPPAAAPRRLLLLRVFGYEARTESLFDRVAQTWRFHGPVQLIAGVDLAMRTADPGDLLTLLDGRLAELYVRSPDEVRDRLERLDLQPDPDGRFRINEVYCHDNTWRPMLEALLDTSDTVLMDLRSFSASNAGCVFELQQLVLRLTSASIVLVCDNTTDVPLLHQILGDAWLAARNAGRTRGPGRISIVRIEHDTRRERGQLMQQLLTPHTAAGVAA